VLVIFHIESMHIDDYSLLTLLLNSFSLLRAHTYVVRFVEHGEAGRHATYLNAAWTDSYSEEYPLYVPISATGIRYLRKGGTYQFKIYNFGKADFPAYANLTLSGYYIDTGFPYVESGVAYDTEAFPLHEIARYPIIATFIEFPMDRMDASSKQTVRHTRLHFLPLPSWVHMYVCVLICTRYLLYRIDKRIK
jgi:hypothetical protein